MKDLLVGGCRLYAKSGEEMLWSERLSFPLRFNEEHLLDIGRHKSAGATPLFGICPPMNPRHGPPGHSRNFLEAAAYLDDCLRRFHHASIDCDNRNE